MLLSPYRPGKLYPMKVVLLLQQRQNNAPVTGTFKHFTGAIQFDPADLKQAMSKSPWILILLHLLIKKLPIL